MVVDDEEDMQLLFQQRFRRELRAKDIELHFAMSGAEALDYVEQHHAEESFLVLSDINMPGMSGLELLKRLKARYAHLKVFIITAYDDTHNYQTAMQYGADAYFTKPLDFDALKGRMQAL
jgi:CheY-like chemotaxis protein